MAASRANVPPPILVSCPCSPERQSAAIFPAAQLRPAQSLFGAESLLAAWLAAHPAAAARAWFLAAPEIFAGSASLAALRREAGLGEATLDGIEHRRFGGGRAVRVLKGARNILVLAEDHRAPPLPLGDHPFAPGPTLPASIEALELVEAGQARLGAIGGAAPPATIFADGLATADLTAQTTGRRRKSPDALPMAKLVGWRPDDWAARAVPMPAGGVLIPWNLADPGSCIPDLLRTLAERSGEAMPAMLLYPFNEAAGWGALEALARTLGKMIGGRAGGGPLVTRLMDAAALPALRAVCAVAWVDGNDPEHRWTLRRLAACGIPAVLIDRWPALAPPHGVTVTRIPADTVARRVVDTDHGRLLTEIHGLSPRRLAALLRATAAG